MHSMDIIPTKTPIQKQEQRGQYICNKCGKILTTSKGFIIHKQGHLKQKPYPCNQCPRQFVQKTHLINHTKRHLEERPYPCSICDKKFYTKGNLYSHKKVHEKKWPEKIHECTTCRKKFTTKSYLTFHKKHCEKKNILIYENISISNIIYKLYTETPMNIKNFNDELTSDWIDEL